jgi:L-threonylcarbamoyladenylate synthase
MRIFQIVWIMGKILKVNAKNPEKEKIEVAARIIKNGGIVIFPTETVYGIGASAFNEKAIRRLYKIKGRPADNPSIIHIARKKDLYEIAEIPRKNKKALEKLVKKFWPGPLTLVLKNKKIPKSATAGLETVAVRMPANKIAIELIKRAGPIAAPSANISGKPSATSVKMLGELVEKVDLVLDGGESKIGLESTVFDVSSRKVLRPGKISPEELSKVLGEKIGKIKRVRKPKSPGLKYKHYSPDAKVIVVFGSKRKIERFVKNLSRKNKVGAILLKKIEPAGPLKLVKNYKDYAKNLFKYFKKFDEAGCDVIICEGVKEIGIGHAIMDRLKKASERIIKL